MDDEKETGWEFKTKRYTIYLDCYHYWCDYALPVRLSIEYLEKDYIEIRLQILCFTFEFIRISHEYSKKLDKILKDYHNEKN